jgi:hypothetical protein
MAHNVSGHNAVVFAAKESVREAVFNKLVEPRPSAPACRSASGTQAGNTKPRQKQWSG